VAAELRPDVIAIDSPPGPAVSGGSRAGERALLHMGIHCYFTPCDPVQWAQPFYAWMHEGQRAFAAVEVAGYPLYRGRGTIRRRALEVFPHATAVLLGGDGALPKGKRRRRVLEAEGVDTTALRSIDQLDAALAALTGLLALDGCCEALGDPSEGVVVVPRQNGPAPT
jgi:predicted RNase H-like nuclease